MGGALLGISKKSIFIFKTRQKMVTKFGQLKKLKCREGSQICKLSQLCCQFLLRFENENIFFISLAIPRPSRSGIHWPINLTKIINVSVYFQKKKRDKFFRDYSLLFSFALFCCCWKYTESSIFPKKLTIMYIFNQKKSKTEEKRRVL